MLVTEGLSPTTSPASALPTTSLRPPSRRRPPSKPPLRPTTSTTTTTNLPITIPLPPPLLPNLPLPPLPPIIQPLLILTTQPPHLPPPLPLHPPIQLHHPTNLRHPLLPLTLKPRALGPTRNFLFIHHEILPLPYLHLRLPQHLLLLFLTQHILHLNRHLFQPLRPRVRHRGIDNPAGDGGTLRPGGSDGRFDDFAVGLGGDGAGAAGAAGARGAADAVEVDFVRLRRFVVDDCFDAFDVETAGGEVGGEEEGGGAGAEGLDACDALLGALVRMLG